MVALAVAMDRDGTEARRAVEQILAAQSLLGGDPHLAGDGALAMGIRRRTLLPEDRFDDQPEVSPDLRLFVAADLRLDNRDDLLQALDLDGRAMADSAVLAAAYRRWGHDCVAHLVGDFAFAIFDLQSRALFFARDATGRRPLALWRRDSVFAMASVPNAFRGLSGAQQGFNEEAFARWIATLRDESSINFWPDVDIVPSGHLGTFQNGELTVSRWWDPRTVADLRLARNADYAEAAQDVLKTAVDASLRTSAGIAVHLSAGLDSTAVVATAAGLLHARGERLLALTGAPSTRVSRRGDEAALAAETAGRFDNIDHRIVRGYDADPIALLDRLSDATGMPTFNMRDMAWWQQMHAVAAGQGRTCVLTGTQGNATLSYSGIGLIAQDLTTGRAWRGLGRLLLGISQIRIGPRTLIDSLAAPVAAAWGQSTQSHPMWSHLTRNLDRSRKIDCFAGAALMQRYGLRAQMKKRWNRVQTGAAFSFDADRVSMLMRWTSGLAIKSELAFHGIDLRAPLADRRVIEFCFAIPPEQFILNGVPRSLGRRIVKAYAPTAILRARFRGVQAADFAETLNRLLPRLREEIDAIDAWQGQHNLVDTEALRKKLAAWEAMPEAERSAQERRINAFLVKTLGAARLARRMEGSNR